nr:unnamed protein product [Naegleria fowleri]
MPAENVEQAEQQTVDETIDNPEVIKKYKLGAEIVNEAIKHIQTLLKPGAKVIELCAAGDAFMEDKIKHAFKKSKGLKKGIAFPTCINVNEIVCHLSPLENTPEANLTLNEGDVLRVDLGVQIDGYISLGAQTYVLTSNVVTGREADCLAAVHQGMEVAQRMMKPGKTNIELMKALQKVAETFGVKWVNGVLSHEMKRDVIDGKNVILPHFDVDQTVEEFKFEANQVYCLDLVATTGEEGKLREGTARATIYKREPSVLVDLKVHASRKIYEEIKEKFGAVPFSVKHLDPKMGRMGILELLNYRMIDPYPVLCAKKGEFVAQLKSTVLITKKQVQKVTGLPLQAFQSDKSIQDENLLAILKSGLKVVAQKEENKMDETD